MGVKTTRRESAQMTDSAHNPADECGMTFSEAEWLRVQQRS